MIYQRECFGFRKSIEDLSAGYSGLLVLTIANHVDLVVVHEDPNTHQEGEQKFVFFKQATAHVWVQTERKIVVDVVDSFFHVVWNERQR